MSLGCQNNRRCYGGRKPRQNRGLPDKKFCPCNFGLCANKPQGKSPANSDSYNQANANQDRKLVNYQRKPVIEANIAAQKPLKTLKALIKPSLAEPLQAIYTGLRFMVWLEKIYRIEKNIHFYFKKANATFLLNIVVGKVTYINFGPA